MAKWPSSQMLAESQTGEGRSAPLEVCAFSPESANESAAERAQGHEPEGSVRQPLPGTGGPSRRVARPGAKGHAPRVAYGSPSQVPAAPHRG